MVTKENLEDELKEAMRSGDDLKKSTLRMILTSAKLAEVENGAPLTEEQINEVITKEAKSRQESLDEAREVGRDDLATQAEAELDLLQTYLPEQLSDEELEALARQSIDETGVTDSADMGDVMKSLMPKVKGRADGKRVSQVVMTLLS